MYHMFFHNFPFLILGGTGSPFFHKTSRQHSARRHSQQGWLTFLTYPFPLLLFSFLLRWHWFCDMHIDHLIWCLYVHLHFSSLFSSSSHCALRCSDILSLFHEQSLFWSIMRMRWKAYFLQANFLSRKFPKRSFIHAIIAQAIIIWSDHYSRSFSATIHRPNISPRFQALSSTIFLQVIY